MLSTVVLEKTLESPLDCKEIKPVNPKGNQPWRFIGRTDTEAEAPILWPCDAESWLFGKDPDAGKVEGRRRRGHQRTKWLDRLIDSMDMSLSKFWELGKDREAWHAAVHRVAKNQIRQRPNNNTTELRIKIVSYTVCVLYPPYMKKKCWHISIRALTIASRQCQSEMLTQAAARGSQSLLGSNMIKSRQAVARVMN